MYANTALSMNAATLKKLPDTPTAFSILMPPAQKITPGLDFKQAACQLPQEARFSVDVLKARSWHSCDRLQVNMIVGRKISLPVDEIAEDDVPGQTRDEKRHYLCEAYTAACRSLKITFEQSPTALDGWRVEQTMADDGGGSSNFVMLHHGVDRLRAWVGFDTGTEARRILGWSPRRQERGDALFAPFYR